MSASVSQPTDAVRGGTRQQWEAEIRQVWPSLRYLPLVDDEATLREIGRQMIAVTRKRLAAGEAVARMYQEPGLAWLERQAKVAEDWSPNVRQQQSATPTDVGAPSALVAD